MSASRRARRAVTTALAVCAAVLLVDAPARALDRAGYLAIADRLQAHLDAHWNEGFGRYDPGPGDMVTQVNADLLLVHAVAARHGHDGPARNDRRARLLTQFLVGPDAWTERPPPGAGRGVHGPGWRSAPDRPSLHMVFVTEAAEALTQAYLARDQIALDAGTVALIRREIARVAASPDWRWPALRLNQFNWYCSIFAAHATVNGARAALADGMARHLARFLAGAVGRRGAAGNLGPGLHFHYLPSQPSHARVNFDSAEYANIVLGFSRFYGDARRAGMRPPRHARLLREWVRRALAGYWTHAGSLNWDTGLGFLRWHQRKKVPLAQHALLGIAVEPELQPTPAWGSWAKSLLDRGLELYAELADRGDRIPDALAHALNERPQARGDAILAAARTAANAMRALAAGLGGVAARRPPALYAFDPDTGRLAVTTPAYNTAIVAVNRRAFPYGGLDIARLLDGRGAVAASIGGVPPASFGLRVRSRAGRVVLATQYGSRARGPAPLRLTHGPRGVGAGARTRARKAYAGSFTELRVRGSVRARGRRATSAYRFTAGAIAGSWSMAGRPGDVATVAFPSWGAGARITALLRDGRTVPVGAGPLALAGVRSLHVASTDSGYHVIPLRPPRGALVRTVATSPQSSAPDPGPSLEVVLAGRRAAFAARIVVDSARSDVAA